MSKLLQAGLLAAIVLGLASSSGSAVDRDAVNKAIDKGVKSLRKMQADDGTWPYPDIGATALAGLTLLECGAKEDDKAVVRAADAVRKASLTLTHNYSISLAILFFDRLGDPDDVPLIESLTVRLLAAQTPTGGWNYRSSPVSDAEVRRLQAVVANRKELAGRHERVRPGAVKRTVRDLPREIQQQLMQLDRLGGLVRQMGSDNSNTQFATLALWVARRYGMPVDEALKRVERRFRGTQQSDGGWGYFERGSAVGPTARSTASMTCAGLLGLAVADGSAADREGKDDRKRARDLDKDRHLRRGLAALSTAVGQPRGRGDRRAEGVPLTRLGGRTFYFLWSLERVSVALDLKTIGKKDWYAWGAELLLANQQANGGWQGTYAECGADTCFALLFLKRANLVPDLTTQLTGRVKDPGERVLKSSRDTEPLEKIGQLSPGLEGKDSKSGTDGRYPDSISKNRESSPRTDPQPSEVVKPATPANSARSVAARMAGDLVKATGTRQRELLRMMQQGKGADFTEALSLAIPQLRGERQQKAREILVERLTRMKETTLSTYLGDDLSEIRRAAALACAAKGSKALIPRLIPLLTNAPEVAEAAHQALKQLSGEDFGPAAEASREEHKQAVGRWLDWWKKHKDEDNEGK